jgi:uncharacterized protein
MYADELLKPWLDALTDALPPMPLVDAHTHIGRHDPSGFAVDLEQLTGSLDLIGGRAVVFPLSEPAGYRQANLTCAEAAASSDGRLSAFVRLTPDQAPDDLLEEGLAAGVRGVKLHPASDEFAIDDPRLQDVYARSDELQLPVVVHAGPELDGVGETALKLCRRYPGLRMVLAHCALTDLGWIWRHVEETPNLFFDTSWWGPTHLLALLELVPPGRILNASDLPYCSPLSSAFTTLRCGIQAGLDHDQLASVAGGQCIRLLERKQPLDLGPPPERPPHPGPLLERLSSTLIAIMEPLQRGDSPGTLLDVARHGCKIPDDHPDAPVVASVARLIDLYDQHHESLPQINQFTPGWDLLAAAAIIARTPAAPLPD